MAEEITKSISEEKGNVLKPNFEVEDLKKMVEENKIKELEGFITENKKITVKYKIDGKNKKAEINIKRFTVLDYLNFALILISIGVKEKDFISSGDRADFSRNSLVIKGISLKFDEKYKLLETLFYKCCNVYYKKILKQIDCCNTTCSINNSTVIIMLIFAVFENYIDKEGVCVSLLMKNMGKLNIEMLKKFESSLPEDCLGRYNYILMGILDKFITSPCKLNSEELLRFMGFIEEKINVFRERFYSNDSLLLFTRLVNFYFMTVKNSSNRIDSDFKIKFDEILKNIFIKIEKPNICFGKILANLSILRTIEEKIEYMIPFLIAMNILSSTSEVNYIVEVLKTENNIVYLKNIYDECEKIGNKIKEIEDGSDKTNEIIKEKYKIEFENFSNLMKNYANPIIDYINKIFNENENIASNYVEFYINGILNNIEEQKYQKKTMFLEDKTTEEDKKQIAINFIGNIIKENKDNLISHTKKVFDDNDVNIIEKNIDEKNAKIMSDAEKVDNITDFEKFVDDFIEKAFNSDKEIVLSSIKEYNSAKDKAVENLVKLIWNSKANKLNLTKVNKKLKLSQFIEYVFGTDKLKEEDCNENEYIQGLINLKLVEIKQIEEEERYERKRKILPQKKSKKHQGDKKLKKENERLKKENEELKKIKEEYERLKQENERLKQENEELKKAKEEENAKEIKIEEKEKTKTEIKKAGSEKGESVFTSSSICGPSSGCISVESNAVMSQNVMGKTRDEGKIPSFQETATQTKKYIGQKVQGLIAKFESKENQDKNEGKASLTRSSTLWK